MSPKQKPQKPIAIYTRVSDQGDRSNEELLSHDLQRAKVASYLAAKDLTASTELFTDNDRSGGKMSRPALDRIRKGIEEGRLGGLAVAYLDRFARTVKEGLETIEWIEQHDAAVIALDCDFDTSTAMGRAMLRIVMVFNALYREQAVEKARYLATTKIERGTSTGGSAPAGYEYEIIGQDSNGKNLLGWLVPSAQAPVVREAFERFDRHELATTGRVADYLNTEGVRTSRGNVWNGMNVRTLLANKVYIGTRHYGDVEVPGAHTEIVDADVFRRVQRQLQPKGVGRTRTRGDGHVLGQGLCRCGFCGAALTKGAANTKYMTLRCNARGKGHAAIMYGLAEDWIVGVAFAHAAGMSVLTEGGNVEEVEAADRVLQSALDELAEVEALRGTMKPAAFGMALSDAQGAVDAAQEARDELQLQAGSSRLLFAAGNRERFAELPITEQRAALRSIVERVVITPGRGPLAERIVIEFVDGSRHPVDFKLLQIPQVENVTVEVAA
jgi:DNA invertase Pin-like site-specific DNA recombinase